ncbi:GNAT family N-acetyltransferase [Alkalihalobacillus sp. LMS6]|uniref:GNAT family N-acetyltransferase n=1 Tax=Alkalihalobacillus sp. LMS6 TaxID=2924034 RepID=UPI0020D04A0A|nr:GNAT family N-acetyltransferase [Alkalihalobacillus sp. LMS6]UTR07005.1 GNAT family N-acetyltransferase [Alkalihalobacillus sp. LMS6]
MENAYGSTRLGGFLTDFVRWGEIYDVVVDDSFQVKGIGTELIKQLIDHEKVSRVRTFSLGASPGKSFFYERLSFRKVTDLGGEYFILVRKERDRELE